jgi:hypothetical protein
MACLAPRWLSSVALDGPSLAIYFSAWAAIQVVAGRKPVRAP